ncbi:AAA family ATPase [Thermoproteota archaeon]
MGLKIVAVASNKNQVLIKVPLIDDCNIIVILDCASTDIGNEINYELDDYLKGLNELGSQEKDLIDYQGSCEASRNITISENTECFLKLSFNDRAALSTNPFRNAQGIFIKTDSGYLKIIDIKTLENGNKELSFCEQTFDKTTFPYQFYKDNKWIIELNIKGHIDNIRFNRSPHPNASTGDRQALDSEGRLPIKNLSFTFTPPPRVPTPIEILITELEKKSIKKKVLDELKKETNDLSGDLSKNKLFKLALEIFKGKDDWEKLFDKGIMPGFKSRLEDLFIAALNEKNWGLIQFIIEIKGLNRDLTENNLFQLALANVTDKNDWGQLFDLGIKPDFKLSQKAGRKSKGDKKAWLEEEAGVKAALKSGLTAKNWALIEWILEQDKENGSLKRDHIKACVMTKLEDGNYPAHILLKEQQVSIYQKCLQKTFIWKCKEDFIAQVSDGGKTHFDTAIESRNIDLLETLIPHQNLQTLITTYPLVTVEGRTPVLTRMRELFSELLQNAEHNKNVIEQDILSLLTGLSTPPVSTVDKESPETRSQDTQTQGIHPDILGLDLGFRWGNTRLLFQVIGLIAKHQIDVKTLIPVLNGLSDTFLLSLKDNDGNTLIHISAEHADIELTTYLMARGFCGVMANNSGQTAVTVVQASIQDINKNEKEAEKFRDKQICLKQIETLFLDQIKELGDMWDAPQASFSIKQQNAYVEIGNTRLPKRTDIDKKDLLYIPGPGSELLPVGSTQEILSFLSTCVSLNHPALLVGETASGKTSLVRYLAHLTNTPLRRMNFSKQTEVSELVGTWRYIAYEDETGTHQAKITWADALLIEAMKKGQWILLDEVNLAPAAVLGRLNAFFNSPNLFIVHEGGHYERVEVHKDFRLFAAMNEADEAGRNILSADFINRFSCAHVKVLDPEFLKAIVKHKFEFNDVLVENLVSFHSKIDEMGKKGTLGAGEIEKYVFTLRTLLRLGGRIAQIGKKRDVSPDSLTMDAELLGEVFETYTLMLRDTKDTELVTQALAEVFSKELIDAFVEQDAEHEYILERKGTEAQRHEAASQPGTKAQRHKGTEGEGISKKKGSKEPGDILRIHSVELEKINNGSACVPDEHFELFPTKTTRQHLYQIAKAVSMGEQVMLTGPTASGKTSIVMWLARLMGVGCELISIDEQTEVSDLIGQYIEKADEKDETNRIIVFEKGKLLKAIERGDWVVLDEINLAKPEIIERLNSLLDDDRMIVVTEDGEMAPIKAHPNFRLFTTMNPAGHYQGRKPLSNAMRNKFSELYISDVFETDEYKEILEFYLDEKHHTHLDDIVNVFTGMNAYLKKSFPYGMEDGLGYLTIRNLRLAARYINDLCPNETASAEQLKEAFMFCFVDQYSEGTVHVEFERMFSEGTEGKEERISEKGKGTEAQRHKGTKKKKGKKDTVPAEVFTINGVSLAKRDLNSLSEEDKLFVPKEKTNFHLFEKTKHYLSDMAKAVTLKQPMLLIGETAGGKTTLVEELAAQTNTPFRRMNFSRMTEKSELIGSWQIKVKTHDQAEDQAEDQDGGYSIIWVDGILLDAMKHGHWLLLDELNLAPAALLGRLNALFNAPELFIVHEDGHEETVHVHEGFRLFGAMNKQGEIGRQLFSPDIMNRFLVREIQPLTKEEMSELVQTCYGFLKEDADRLAAFHCDMQERVETMELGGDQREKYVYSLRTFQRLAKRLEEEGTEYLCEIMHVYGDMLRSEADRACFVRILSDHFGETHIKNALLKEDQNPYELTDIEITDPSIITVRTARKWITQIRKALQFNEHILLAGPTASGKTSLVQVLGEALGIQVDVISIDGQTEVSDFLGSYVQKKGEEGEPVIVFEPGPLVKAMRNGSWIVFDEVNTAKPEVLERINSLLDDDRRLILTEGGIKTPITCHENFRFFSTMNPVGKYQGRKELSKPMRNKFTEMYIDEIANEDELKEIVGELMRSELTGSADKQAAGKQGKAKRPKPEAIDPKGDYTQALVSLYMDINRYINEHYPDHTDPGFGTNTLRNLRLGVDYFKQFSKTLGKNQAFVHGALFALAEHFNEKDIREYAEERLMTLFSASIPILRPSLAKSGEHDLDEMDLRESVKLSDVQSISDLLLFLMERSAICDPKIEEEIRKTVKNLSDADPLMFGYFIDSIKDEELKATLISIYSNLIVPKIHEIYDIKNNKDKLLSIAELLTKWNQKDLIKLLLQNYNLNDDFRSYKFIKQLVKITGAEDIREIVEEYYKQEIKNYAQPYSAHYDKMRFFSKNGEILRSLGLVKDIDASFKKEGRKISITIQYSDLSQAIIKIKEPSKLQDYYFYNEFLGITALLPSDRPIPKKIQNYILDLKKSRDCKSLPPTSPRIDFACKLIQYGHLEHNKKFIEDFLFQCKYRSMYWADAAMVNIAIKIARNKPKEAINSINSRDTMRKNLLKCFMHTFPTYSADLINTIREKGLISINDSFSRHYYFDKSLMRPFLRINNTLDTPPGEDVLSILSKFKIKEKGLSEKHTSDYIAMSSQILQWAKRSTMDIDPLLDIFEKQLKEGKGICTYHLVSIEYIYIQLSRFNRLVFFYKNIEKRDLKTSGDTSWRKNLQPKDLKEYLKNLHLLESGTEALKHINWDLLDKDETILFDEIFMEEDEEAEKRITIWPNKVKIVNQDLPRKSIDSDTIDLVPDQSYALYPLKPTMETMEAMAAAVNLDKPFLLIGDTAGGKTSMVYWLAHLTRSPLVRINLSKQTEKQDLIGSWQMVAAEDENGKQEIVWAPGLLVQAMQNGYWALLDEVNLAPADVLARLNNLFNAKKCFLVHESGAKEPMTIHKDFRLFATMNKASERGRAQLSRDFLNRFVHRYVPNLSQEDLQVILSRFYSIPPAMCPTLIEFHTRMVQMAKDEEIGLDEQEKYIYSFRTLQKLVNRIEALARQRAQKRGIVPDQLDKEAKIIMQEMTLNADSPDQGILGELIHVYGDIIRSEYDKDIFRQNLNIFFGKEHVDACIKAEEAMDCSIKIEDGVLTIGSVRMPLINNGSDAVPGDYADLIPIPTSLKHLHKIAKAVQLKEHLMLTGPTASGKTSLALWLARLLGVGAHMISLDEHTDVADLIGQHIQSVDEDGKMCIVFEKGPLIKAMERGDWVIFDEVNLARPEIIERINSLLDNSRMMVLSESGHLIPVKCHPNFRLICTMNPAGKYQGRHVLSDAMRNKFTELYIPGTYTQEDLSMLMQDVMGTFAQACATSFLNFNALFNAQNEEDSALRGETGLTIRDLKRWEQAAEYIRQQQQTDGYHVLVDSAKYMINRFSWENQKAFQQSLVTSLLNQAVSPVSILQTSNLSSFNLEVAAGPGDSTFKIITQESLLGIPWDGDLDTISDYKLSKEEKDQIRAKAKFMASAAATVVNRTLNIRITRHGFAYDPDSDTFYMGLNELRKKTDEELAMIPLHEAGHAAFTRAKDPWLAKSAHHHCLYNTLEDPRVNNGVIERFPGTKPRFVNGYKWAYPEHNFSPFDDYKILLSQQLCLGLIHYWAHGKEHPKIVNADVKEAFNRVKPASQKIWDLIPKGRVPLSQDRSKLTRQCLTLVREEFPDLFKTLSPKQWKHELLHLFYHGVYSERVYKDKELREFFDRLSEYYEGKFGNKIENEFIVQIDATEKGKELLADRELTLIKKQIWPVYEDLLEKSKDIMKNRPKNPPQNPQDFDPEQASHGVFPGLDDEKNELPSNRIDRKLEKHAKELADKLESKVLPSVQDRIDEQRKHEKENEKILRSQKPGGRTVLDKIKRNMGIRPEIVRNPYTTPLLKVCTLSTQFKNRLSNVFVPNSELDWVGYYTTGKLSVEKLIQTQLSGVFNSRIFMKRTRPEGRDYRFSIVLDMSYSMHGERQQKALESLALLIEALNSLKLKYNIIGFSDSAALYKPFTEDLSTMSKKIKLYQDLEDGFAHGGITNDIEGLNTAIESLEYDPGTSNYVIMITDGYGNADVPGMSMDGLQAHAKKSGISVVGVGIGEGVDAVKKTYEEHVQVPDINKLPAELSRLLEKLLVS